MGVQGGQGWAPEPRVAHRPRRAQTTPRVPPRATMPPKSHHGLPYSKVPTAEVEMTSVSSVGNPEGERRYAQTQLKHGIPPEEKLLSSPLKTAGNIFISFVGMSELLCSARILACRSAPLLQNH